MDLLLYMDTFVRVVDSGSLSGAARSARLSLPAVSRQLSALERQLGTQLIVRSTRRLSVTEAGHRFYGHARSALREAEEAMTSARSARSISGRLSVSAPFTFGLHHVVPRLERLTARHPGLTVDLFLEDNVVDLVARGIDVAVRAGVTPPDSTAFVAHPMAPIRRFPVAAPAYLKKHGVPREPVDLEKHRCLSQLLPSSAVWRFVRGGEERSADVTAIVRCSTPSALLELARSGVGIAMLPDWLIEPEVKKGRLRRVLPEWDTPAVSAWILHRAHLGTAARVRAFVEAMQ
jgi:DNA-binding transcriptional LysR family regulator